MKIKTEKISKKAFTLAEILVTLSILGVVFAAVAPTVNTFNQERTEKTYKAKTGKAYSMLSDALRAKFLTTQKRMVGDPEASNLVDYLTDNTVGSIKTINELDNAFKTPDGMVFAVSGDNCHQHACFVIVDVDGQKKGITKKTVEEMIENFDVYRDAPIEEAKNQQNGHGDIAVFMVKDGQVYPYTRYTADNIQMDRNTVKSLATSEIDLQFSELNISPD